MGKLRSPIEAEELADRAAEALHEINHFGADPKKVLIFFLESMEERLKSYFNDIFDIQFDWLELDLWQLLPEIEELAACRFSEETPNEKNFWINHLQEVADYFIGLYSIASPEHLNELPKGTVREYALLILGSMTISAKLSEKPLNHSVDGPTREEFRILYGPYPQIEDMPPGSIAGEMAAIIDSSRKVWGLDTNISPREKPKGPYLFAEIISRDPLHYAYQYSDRWHLLGRAAEGITIGDSKDERFSPSQSADFVKHVRQAIRFRQAEKEYGDIPDSYILAVAAISSAYSALRDIQHQEYRAWKKSDQETINEYASDARNFKQRLDQIISQENAGKSLSSKRKKPGEQYYQRVTGECKKRLNIAMALENPDQIPYRHTIEKEVAAEFDKKGFFVPTEATRKKWFARNIPQYSWATWDSSHSTPPTSKYVPRSQVEQHINKINNR